MKRSITTLIALLVVCSAVCAVLPNGQASDETNTALLQAIDGLEFRSKGSLANEASFEMAAKLASEAGEVENAARYHAAYLYFRGRREAYEESAEYLTLLLDDIPLTVGPVLSMAPTTQPLKNAPERTQIRARDARAGSRKNRVQPKQD